MKVFRISAIRLLALFIFAAVLVCVWTVQRSISKPYQVSSFRHENAVYESKSAHATGHDSNNIVNTPTGKPPIPSEDLRDPQDELLTVAASPRAPADNSAILASSTPIRPPSSGSSDDPPPLSADPPPLSADPPHLSADPPPLSADPPPPFGSHLVLAENYPGEDGRFPLQDYFHLKRAGLEINNEKMEDGERRKVWNVLLEKLENEKMIKKLPNIIGIGVQKCGTFALKRFLSYHPLMKVHHGEGQFFGFVPPSENDRKNYLKMLEKVKESVYLMEKTPEYFISIGTAQRMKRVDPGAKLLLILCDPTHRVASNFAHEMQSENNRTLEIKARYESVDQYVNDTLPKVERAMGTLAETWNVTTLSEKREELLGLNCLSQILEKGFYLLHLLPWLKYYNESNLLIVNGNEMLVNPGSVIERVQDFLGLPRLLLKSDFVKDPKTGFFCFKDWREGGKLRCMPEEKRRTRKGKFLSEENTERLRKMYSSYNEALYTALGANLGW